MATDLATLVRRTRRFVRDTPDLDTITASVTSSATTLKVVDTTKYAVNQRIELDYETMIVRALTDATTLTVTRAALDSTAATHASSASILKSPAFYFADIVDGLNQGIDAMFPLIYKEVVDESLTSTATVYEYTVPNMPGTYGGDTIPIQFISEVKYKITGDLKFYPRRDWRVLRGATPKILFAHDLAPATLRVVGYGPFPALSATSDTLDAQFPKRCERLLSMYAANWLLMSGESGRVRHDSGAIDAREQASRVGASSAQANALYQRFAAQLRDLAMPPMPRHIVPTFPSF